MIGLLAAEVAFVFYRLALDEISQRLFGKAVWADKFRHIAAFFPMLRERLYCYLRTTEVCTALTHRPRAKPERLAAQDDVIFEEFQVFQLYPLTIAKSTRCKLSSL